MSATPRVRSGAFPVTPRTVRRPAASFPTPQSNMSSVRSTPESAGPAPKKQPLPEAPESKPTASSGPQPRIPTSILEAPTQRLYVAGIYVGLLGWRLWDWIQVVENDADSNWLLFKWAVLDAVFFFGLPELRIPWLELSSPFASAAWLFHVFVTLAMMYNIGFPFQAWLLAFVKAVYDRELAVSEHSIRVSDLIHNSSLIMGKQIINILPEGSAVLNPEGVPFCLGGDVSTVSLPIFFNATIPDEVELVRADFDGERQETLRLNRNQLKDIAKRAKRNTEEATEELVRFDYPVKKVGVYRLSKVLDEYKLEVQRPSPDTLVVQCPRARIVPPASSSRCFGDLSDLSLEVEGSPPLKIVYSRTINGKDHSFHFQSLQPDGFTSPLLGSPPSMSLVRPGEDDMSWARPRKVPVGLNESMNIAGAWQYSVDEVHDAFGNVARYSHPADDPELKPKPKHLVQNFVVKERPRLGFKGCDSRNPLKAQRGKAVNLPVELRFSGRMPDDTSYRVAWQFSPIDTLTQSGEPGDVVIEESYSASNAHDRPVVYKPGLYTLKSVSSGSCEGEIQEPSACLLMNPLEPSISLSAQDIADKCAGNSIGLRVAMDLIGTPPFVVRYDVYDKDNRHLATHREKIPGLRHQMDLTPREAGHYKYKFTEIDDSIYKHQPLRGPDMVLEQTVKPAASAKIVGSSRTDACLEDVAEVRVALLGDGPFNLAWEMVHDGKRTQHSATAIDASEYTIKTPPLSKAGSYTLTLTSVEDKAGCRTFLKDEVKIEVRRRPRAGFGLMDGRRKVTVVEGSLVNIPLRLHGVPPFSLDYRNLNGSAEPVTREFGSANDALRVRSPGVYEITAVRDSQCDGTVDELASTFEVDLFPRPELAIIEADGITQRGNVYVKKDVCEGDIDGFEISLKGLSLPFLFFLFLSIVLYSS